MICVKKAELAGHLHADCSLEVAHVLPLFLFLFILFVHILDTHAISQSCSSIKLSCPYSRRSKDSNDQACLYCRSSGSP